MQLACRKIAVEKSSLCCRLAFYHASSILLSFLSISPQGGPFSTSHKPPALWRLEEFRPLDWCSLTVYLFRQRCHLFAEWLSWWLSLGPTQGERKASVVSQCFGLPVPSLIPDQLMDSEFNADVCFPRRRVHSFISLSKD